MQERVPLISPSPGTHREIIVYRFGSGSPGPRVYLQAGLHADEWPGLLVLQHLLSRLDSAEQSGLIRGEIVIVPFANPVGLSQNVSGYLAGRFDLVGTGNFNRGFPELADSVPLAVEDKLGMDEQQNRDLVSKAARESIESWVALDEATALKKQLLMLSLGADYVLDLHCDDRTTAHIYAARVQQEAACAMAARLEIETVLLEDLVGPVAFDGTHLKFWYALSEAFPDKPLGRAPLAVTVEYRGQHDVDDALAKEDAERLYHYLGDIGILDLPVQPPDLSVSGVQALPLEGLDVLKAPVAGLVVFHCALEEWVEAGQLFAEIVLLDADQPNQRIPVYTSTSGSVMGLSHRRLVRPGDQVGKIAGEKALDYRKSGQLLQL